MDTAAVAFELQRTWHREDAAPNYQLLIASDGKAQDAVRKDERLDSSR